MNDDLTLPLETHSWIWLQSGESERFPGGSVRAIEQAAARRNLLLSISLGRSTAIQLTASWLPPRGEPVPAC